MAEPEKTTSTSFKRTSLQAHPKMRMRRLLRSWPFLVWISIIFLAMFFYSRSAQYGGMAGNVETIVEPIAPLETARIMKIYVKTGDRVTNNQPIVQMDTSIVDAEMAMDVATLSEAEGAVAGWEQNIHQLFQRFETQIADAETALQEQRILQMRDTAQLEVLAKEQDRRNELLKNKMIDAITANMLKPEIAALEKAVGAYPELMDINQRKVKDALDQMKKLRKSLKIADDEDIYKAVEKKFEARYQLIATGKRLREIERETYTLRSTRGGTVSSIALFPGDVVDAGTEIVRIVGDKSDDVIGFLPEVHLTSVRIGDKAAIIRQYGPGRPIPATVETISPEVEGLPGRVSPVQGQMVRGRRVILHITEPHDLIPGETVRIRTMSPFMFRMKQLLAGWGL